MLQSMIYRFVDVNLNSIVTVILTRNGRKIATLQHSLTIRPKMFHVVVCLRTRCGVPEMILRI